MSMQKRLLAQGLVMLAGFFIVLVLIFSPIFPGKTNGLVYMDNLFNMISKGSCYFIPDAREDNKPFIGQQVDLKMTLPGAAQAEQVKTMLEYQGAQVAMDGSELIVSTDLGAMIEQVLADAELMYNNDGSGIAAAYGFSGKQAIYNWWTTLKAMKNSLTTDRDFKSAKLLDDINRRVIEPAYNYHDVEPMMWQDNIMLILAALAFYVIYTMWYGFGLLYLFEGLGLKTGH